MQQNATEKPLTAKQAKAAALLAADDLSDEEIAAQVGVHRVTMARWKEIPEFRAAIAEHVAAVETAMLRLDIAKRHKRVAVLNDLHDKLLTVIDDRAAHYDAIAIEQAQSESDKRRMVRVAAEMFGTTDESTVPPGGQTGLVVRQLKMVGSGMTAKIVEEFGVDTGLIKEIRGVQEQAAKELGQWVDRSEQTGKTTNRIELIGVDASDI